MEPDSLPSWFMLFVGSHGTRHPSPTRATAQHRQDIAEVTSDLWDYYQELKAYQQPYSRERERLDRRFDEVFGRRYPEHYGLNLALQQFCTYKQELLRVLDAPQVPLHTNALSLTFESMLLGAKLAAEPAMTMVVEPAIPLRD